MLFLSSVLSDDRMNNSLEDVLLGNNTLHILDQIVSLIRLVILQVVNNEIDSGLWNNIY